MGKPVYRLSGMTRHWISEGDGFQLEIPDLTIHPGERIAVIGVSGSGKSTFLDMLGLVLKPSTVQTFLFAPPGEEASDVAAIWQRREPDRLGELRKRHIGYILQTGALLPFVTVRDNIALSCQLLGIEDDGRIEALASRLGIARHLGKRPAALSVGERQRVAIARALAHRPAVIIADEPTAALDPETTTRIIELFLEIADEAKLTMIFASHDWERMRALGFRCLVPEVSGAVSVLRG